MRARYRDAIDWIARYDSAGDNDALDPECAGALITACLVADVFGKTNEQVGQAIVARRKKLNE
jgi:hypothetical protein